MFNFYHTSKTARWIEILCLLVVMGLAGGAAFSVGHIWAVARHGNMTSGQQVQMLMLLALFAGATALVVFRLLQYATNYRKTEASLQVVEARFNNTFDQFPLSVQILDPDGYTLAVNREWEKLFNATLKEVARFSPLHHPALQKSGIAAHLQRALEGEIAVAPAKEHNMVESWPFSSHEPHVTRWIKCTICPVKNPQGDVTELIIIHEDVTEQKLAREARHESEARKASIVEAALDCIISMDGEGHVIEWNPSAENTFGYKRDEAIGRLLADLIIPEELRQQHAQGMKRYLETGEGKFVGRKIEVTALRSGGAPFPVELAITPLTIGEKRIFSAFLRDLTQSKAAEAALQQAHDELETRVQRRTSELKDALEQLQSNYERLKRLEDLRDTLTGMVVHDLRTPLSSMLYGVQTVNYLGTVTPAQQECLNIFTLGCKDSLSVINDLLDIGKMESGAFTLHREETVPGEMVRQALERVAMLAGVKNLRLEAQIEDDLPSFAADQEKLGRLLGNLLSNAIKFAPQDGIVTLGASLAPDQNAIHFWVRDNGEGIPLEAFERIFEKFGQVETSLGNRETSSGLGLAFCKMIVEAHHGQIWVESQPGQGSLFTAAFPLGKGV